MNWNLLLVVWRREYGLLGSVLAILCLLGALSFAASLPSGTVLGTAIRGLVLASTVGSFLSFVGVVVETVVLNGIIQRHGFETEPVLTHWETWRTLRYIDRSILRPRTWRAAKPLEEFILDKMTVRSSA